MKASSIYAVVVYLAAFACKACLAEDLWDRFATAQASNGLSVAVGTIEVSNKPATTESPIMIFFKAPTNTQSLLFVPKSEYVARIALYDSNSHPVAKTDLGVKYGSQFNLITYDIAKFARRPRSPSGARDTWSLGDELPKASELFAITSPGVYRLKMEVQVMVQYLDTRQKLTKQVVQFPSVEIELIRPDVTNNPARKATSGKQN